MRSMASTAKRYVTQSGLIGPVKGVCQRSCFGLVIRRLGGRGVLTLLALLEPIALAIHRQDVDVVGQTVEQRAGEPLGGKDAGPFVKGQIAGYRPDFSVDVR
jgi:hypothetical protein